MNLPDAMVTSYHGLLYLCIRVDIVSTIYYENIHVVLSLNVYLTKRYFERLTLFFFFFFLPYSSVLLILFLFGGIYRGFLSRRLYICCIQFRFKAHTSSFYNLIRYKCTRNFRFDIDLDVYDLNC